MTTTWAVCTVCQRNVAKLRVPSDRWVLHPPAGNKTFFAGGSKNPVDVLAAIDFDWTTMSRF